MKINLYIREKSLDNINTILMNTKNTTNIMDQPIPKINVPIKADHGNIN